MNEPAIDLGIVLAIASSKKDIIVRQDTTCFGELGLSGEMCIRDRTKAEKTDDQPKDFYLVYAMNDNGESGWYTYDSVDEMCIRDSFILKCAKVSRWIPWTCCLNTA